jgi:hypothetical protein
MSPEKLLYLKGIYFLRGTDDNIKRLADELKDPKFSHYYLCTYSLS